MNKTIELLAPARDLATGRAAIDCGADAVYIGAPAFGARRAAGNSVEDIAVLVRYARPFGVRVYAALNTLLFDSELAEAQRVAQSVIDAGVDALIVQDMAYRRMDLRGNIEFHASTQTANMTPEDVAFLAETGFSRVILERALSLDEILNIRRASDVELEVFVHGAICVGYSGRCFLSRSVGERSGNRGDCSQPCRLSYDLVDGDNHLIIKDKHLLSVLDLDLSAHIGELLDAGVGSFKIEGRLKDIGYVRNITAHYRAILDRELALRPDLERASVGISRLDFVPDPAKSFTRGASDYFFGGTSGGGIAGSPKVASFDTPKSVGERIGKVAATGCERTGNHWFTLETPYPLAAGDGICFSANGKVDGTNINRVEGARIYPANIAGIGCGTIIYRNHDHDFVRSVERSRTRRKIEIGLKISFSDEFEPAKNPEKMMSIIHEEFSKSGDTIFDIAYVNDDVNRYTNDSHKNTVFAPTNDDVNAYRNRYAFTYANSVPFIPVSMLANARREVLEKLFEIRKNIPPARNLKRENLGAKLPHTKIYAAENVTNRLSEQFYRDHGVLEFEPPLETRSSFDGETVLRSRYCIRREIGGCLREKTALKTKEKSEQKNAQFSTQKSTEKSTRNPTQNISQKNELFLTHGQAKYRLDFDCVKCEMTLTKI